MSALTPLEVISVHAQKDMNWHLMDITAQVIYHTNVLFTLIHHDICRAPASNANRGFICSCDAY